MYISKLEHLPDEILIAICLYLNTIDIMNAFGNLNTRLDKTISEFRCDFNFQYFTLKQFQSWFSNILPYNSKYIHKLTLNTWYSPGQISLFNQYISKYESIHAILPNLKQIWLINFTNTDVHILPKLLTIEKVMLDIDAQMPLYYTTKVLLDKYLFCTDNSINELRLCGIEEGLPLQHDVDVQICRNLRKLTISVSTLDDLILIFQRAPYLKKLHIEINSLSSGIPKQSATVEMMPKHIQDVYIWIKDKHLLPFEDLKSILSHMPTIERLSLEIETTDMDFASGYRWKELLFNLPEMTQWNMGLKIWTAFDATLLDVTPYLETFSKNDIDVCCYSDNRVLYIDTIPYEYDTSIGIMTSPRANKAKATNMSLFKKSARKVNTLCFDGRHELTSIDDWLNVISRFSGIQVLDVVSINLIDSNEDNIIDNYKQLRLPNLSILRYIRSTKCKVNIPFFMYFADNSSVAPRVRTLTMMYGDIIFLCKRLPVEYTFNHFKELCLYGNGADGIVRLKDIDLLLQRFPNLEHVWFHFQSSRTINRTIELVIETFVRSLSKLTSFRLSCKKDSLKFSSFNDDNTRRSWSRRVFGSDSSDQVHMIISKQEISIWK